MIRSLSTSAFGQPSDTKPTLGAAFGFARGVLPRAATGRVARVFDRAMVRAGLDMPRVFTGDGGVVQGRGQAAGFTGPVMDTW